MKNSVISLVLKALKKSPGSCLLLIISVIFVVALSLAPPQILKIIIDSNLIPKDKNKLLLLAAAYIGAILFIGVFNFLKEGVLTILGNKITLEIRLALIKKLERINAMFFSENSTGTTVSRFTNDVDTITSLFTNGIIGMIVDLFKIIGVIISMLLFSWKLALFTILVLPVIYLITRLFQKRTLSAQIKNRELTGKVNNHISESLKNFEMIKVYGKESYMEDSYSSVLEENYKTVEKVNYYDAVFPPIIQIIRGSIIALIVVLASSSLGFLGIWAGIIAASIEFISGLFMPVENLGMEFQSIQQAVSGIKRVNGFLSEAEDGEKREIKAKDITAGGKTVFLFKNVSFAYKKGEDVLKNVSLSFEKGQRVTFAGRTGVGKTTLFKLIMGLLKPCEGSISINGVDVYDIPNGEKRYIFGYVGQDMRLVKGTVAQQVSLKDDTLSRGQIEDALASVGLLEFINGLEKGLDTVIENDKLFSQGQKQLLAIARAIVTDPPVLLLDEVTANLDSITEERVISVLHKASGNRAVFSISHRLASMISADTVVLLEKGTVKNSGSPDELLANDDWYRSKIAIEKLTWK